MKLILGNCLEKMKDLEENSVDSIVTDPPYGISFMGKKWDYEVPSVELWEEAMRVLKPGGHLLSFAGSRTYHRMAVNIEDAGFEIRDQIMWVYGSGFPKSHNIGKSVDKLQGNERETSSSNVDCEWLNKGKKCEGHGDKNGRYGETIHATPDKGSSPYEGWGTALKPAHEPIVVARKPLSEKTIAKNVLEWGTGGINIDGCRVGTEEIQSRGGIVSGANNFVGGKNIKREPTINQGRFPANFIHDGSDEVVGLFPNSNGQGKHKKADYNANQPITMGGGQVNTSYTDKGSAARFFYCAKAPKSQRWVHLRCNCETIKLESWQKQDQNQIEKMDGTLPKQDILENKLKEDYNSNTATFGNNQTDQSQKDTPCTTSTKTSSTTDLKTSSSLHLQNTSESIVVVKSETENGGNLANSASNLNQSTQQTGTYQKKGGLFTDVVVPATSKLLLSKNVCVDCNSEIKTDGHPTQKPTKLMQYLVRLVTPVGGTVLDPFMGSGSTGKACVLEGFDFIGIDLDAEYVAIAKARIEGIRKKLESCEK